MQMTSALPVGASDNDRTHFQLAVRGVLEDAQERLIYRVQACCFTRFQKCLFNVCKIAGFGYHRDRDSRAVLKGHRLP